MSLRRLRKSDIRSLESLPVPPGKKDDVQLGDDVLFINGALAYVKPEGMHWVPSLRLLLVHPDTLPKVIVDMGAVRFVTRGADIMRPGMTKIDDFPTGTLVQVVDEKHGKPLAVCKALVSSDEMRAQDSGRVLQNLHYIGDQWWNK